jgi:CRP/FNR family transcriptional regulator
MPAPQLTPSALKAAVKNSNGLLERLMNALPSAVAEKLLSQGVLHELAAGDMVMEPGVRCESVGYVLDGMLGMVQALEDGKTHIIGLLVPTDLYGRLFDGPSNYRIQALSSSRILSFPRAVLEQVLQENPEAERLFLVHLLDEVDAAREWLLLISGRKAVNRLASFLSILARRSRHKRIGGLLAVHVTLSRKDMAHYLGARPETLSRAFRELEVRGILRIIDPYNFRIVDEEALIEAAGDDLTFQDD